MEGERTNLVYKFNFKGSEWSLMMSDEPRPCPRAGHQACFVEVEAQPYMYIFGGKDNDDKMLDDMWRLNLNTQQWQQV